MSKNRFASKEAVVDTQIDVVEQIIKKQKQKEMEGDIHRVNFNMPKYLHDLVRDKMQKKGYNLTNYLLSLVRKDLDEE
jgi:hypothetical protein